MSHEMALPIAEERGFGSGAACVYGAMLACSRVSPPVACACMSFRIILLTTRSFHLGAVLPLPRFALRGDQGNSTRQPMHSVIV